MPVTLASVAYRDERDHVAVETGPTGKAACVAWARASHDSRCLESLPANRHEDVMGEDWCQTIVIVVRVPCCSPVEPRPHPENNEGLPSGRLRGSGISAVVSSCSQKPIGLAELECQLRSLFADA